MEEINEILEDVAWGIMEIMFRNMSVDEKKRLVSRLLLEIAEEEKGDSNE